MPPEPKPKGLEFIRHPDGKLTLGYEHVAALGLMWGSARSREPLEQELAKLNTDAPSPTSVSRATFAGLVHKLIDEAEREEFYKAPPDSLRLLASHMIKTKPDASYRKELIQKMQALLGALKTLDDAVKVQLDAQGGLKTAVLTEDPMTGEAHFKPIESAEIPRDNAGTNLTENERALGDSLLADAQSDLQEKAKILHEQGVTLPKDQADALLGARKLLLAFFSERIFDEVRAKNSETVRALLTLATGLDVEALMIEDIKKNPGRDKHLR